MYLHPESKLPIYEAVIGEHIADAAKHAIETNRKFVLLNDKVYRANDLEDTGLTKEDLLDSELEVLRLQGSAFEWFKTLFKSDLDANFFPGGEVIARWNPDTGMVGFSVTSRFEGKTGNLLTTISGRGKTPQEALETFKKDFESYKAYYHQGKYYVVAADHIFIEVTPEVAQKLAG